MKAKSEFSLRWLVLAVAAAVSLADETAATEHPYDL